VSANIDQGIEFVLFATGNNHRFIGQLKHKPVTGLGNFTHMTGINPAPEKDVLYLTLIDFRVGIIQLVQRPVPGAAIEPLRSDMFSHLYFLLTMIDWYPGTPKS
jgi:hypothetical protein